MSLKEIKIGQTIVTAKGRSGSFVALELPTKKIKTKALLKLLKEFAQELKEVGSDTVEFKEFSKGGNSLDVTFNADPE